VARAHDDDGDDDDDGGGDDALVVLEVSLGDRGTGRIVVHDSDVPERLAQQFIDEHHLDGDEVVDGGVTLRAMLVGLIGALMCDELVCRHRTIEPSCSCCDASDEQARSAGRPRHC
jgi:hypothetical protein